MFCESSDNTQNRCNDASQINIVDHENNEALAFIAQGGYTMTTEEIAIVLIDILFEKQLINDATYRKIKENL